jgi:filamentous hemagglutinin family protein
MSSKKNTTKHSAQILVRNFVLPIVLVSVVGAIATKQSLAQSITPETAPSGTNTTVTPSGNRFDIGGGRLSQDGKNLFHSFTDFGLQQNQIANFLSQPTIQNILGRINGGNPSVINGILQVYGGFSNLFLMNPAGIIFGRDASLNVPASLTATTANAIGFGDNRWFNASGSNDYAALVGTPSSFAFSMTQPAAIVNAANLSLPQGLERNRYLTLLGGTVVSTGQLSGSESNIIVAAVPGTSLVRLSQPGSPLSLEIQPITPGSNQPIPWMLPVLSLAQLMTGGDGGNATGLTVNPDGTVQLIGSGIHVENGDVATVSINTSSTRENAGSILLSAKRDINTTGGTLDASYVVSGLSGPFGGGAITLSAKDGNVTTANINSSSITGLYATGGAITITAGKNITTGNVSSFARTYRYPIGGAIALTSENGNITTGTIDSYSIGGLPGRGGAVTLSAYKGDITTNAITSYGASGYYYGSESGMITLTAGKNIFTGDLDSGTAHLSSIEGYPFYGGGGAILLTANTGGINTGTLNSATNATGRNGGAITVTAYSGKISTGNVYSYSSFSSPEGISLLSGDGGAITFTTNNGTISTGNLFSYSQSSSANAGNGAAITLFANNGGIATGNLHSSTSSGSSNADVGNGGAVTLRASQNITTAEITSGSSGGNRAGNGGMVTLTTQNGNITTGNLDSHASAATPGNGGLIAVTAQTGNIITGNLDSHAAAKYSAANSGVITLSADRNIATGTIDSHASSVNTSNGGVIALTARQGSITTSTLDSHADGEGAYGGAIALNALQNIATGTLDSHAAAGVVAKGGAIALNSQEGNLITGNIDSRASASSFSANGGVIALSTKNGNIATGNVSSNGYGYASGEGGAIALTTKNGNIATGNLASSAGAQSARSGAIALTTQNGNISTGTIDSDSAGRFGDSEAITLTAQRGNIATGDLDSSSTGVYGGKGGAVNATASNTITGGKIDSSAVWGNGGAVTLTTSKDITVSSINAQGGSNGIGGDITLVTTAGAFRATGAFTARDGVTTASISSQGGTDGGQIRIVTAGGLDNLFKVGDPARNGTFKDITSGKYRISSTPVFTIPSPTYTQGNIEIITLP